MPAKKRKRYSIHDMRKAFEAGRTVEFFDNWLNTLKPKVRQKEPKYKALRVNGEFILEHRYIMEIHLGRKLTPDEVVHHINKNGLDNRIENLILTNHSEHRKFHETDWQQYREKFIEGAIKQRKPVMIIDNMGNDLMSVQSIKMAVLVTVSFKSSVKNILRGNAKKSKGFSFRFI